MKTVKDVMSTLPLWVSETASFREIAARLRDCRVSAFPVLDAHGKVTGVVSEADLLVKEAVLGEPGGFAGLLSLFNMAGRFVWASTSDFTGRKFIYIVYLLLGAVLYCLIPLSGHTGNTLFFVAVCVIILSMYGGGFSTIPAYLKDLFGSMQVGAIHGRLLTAWSVAGVLGPVLVNYIREYLKGRGTTGVGLYAPTMYLMAGLLLIGLICNLCVRPVNERYYFHRQNR